MEKIRAIALDFDGVLTDGTFIWGVNGEEYKRMSFLDVMGISLGKKAGFLFALISGEDSPLLDRFANKMGIVDIYKGCRDKATALRDFAQRHKLELAQICFMGDDVNDLPAMELAGMSAAPTGAHESARRKATLVTQHAGGQGAVRELIDLIIACKKIAEIQERS